MINAIWLEEKENFRRRVRTMLYLLVTTLVFEGLVRKIVPSYLGLLLFFLKDIVCFGALIYIVRRKSNVPENLFFLLRIMKVMFIALIPILINTLFRDPILIPFGLKQYLLYTVVGIMTPLAFPPNKFNEFKKFCTYIAYIIVPTTIVAVLQNSLPATHWLNRSVDGNSLEGFAAAGFLRVSSTFAFTGQYSWFLNLASAFIAVHFCLPPKFKSKSFLQAKPLIYPLLSVCLIIGAFVTGGRTAVLGCGACILIGFILSILKSPPKFVFQGVLIVFGISMSLTILNNIKPEFFAAYNQRSSGSEEQSHSEEVENRVFGSFFGWTDWIFMQDGIPILFGNGLGVMSNGSDKISSYAKDIRSKLWTETDLATVAWEGGVYLVFLYYGLRIWIMVKLFSFWKIIKNQVIGIGMSFLLAYILITGLIGTLSTQPPVAIWWWLSVGSAIVISNYNDHINKKAVN